MIERFYRKIFVAIVQDGGGHDVRIVIQKQSKLLLNESKRFEGESSYDQARTYIRKHTEESPLHYVALLNPKSKQGAFPMCSGHTSDEQEELVGAKTLCRKEEWLVYGSLRELDALQSEYKSIGLDFIFSPFSVLEHFFTDKIKGGFALYALALKDSFSVALFENGKLEYAHHYPMHEEKTLAVEEESLDSFAVGIKVDDEIEKGISLDDIESLDDLDILEELEDLSNIEDLDSLDEIAEFSEDEPTFEEKRLSAPKGDSIKKQMDQFNNDYHRFELIQRTLIRFYGSDRCRNRFVETVYIADGYGSGNELKRYLEEELFLNVLIRHIDVTDEIIALAKLEEEGL